MKRRHRSALIVVAALIGCIRTAPPLPHAPRGLDRITVQQPTNKTGDALVVDDLGLLGRLTDAAPTDVPDILAADLRTALINRGVKVIKNPPGSPALRTEIRRWEPYTADYSVVTVDLVASLVEPSTGKELWSAQRSNWKVPTPKAGSRPEASKAASEAIADALVDALQPAEPSDDSKKSAP